VVVDVEQQAPGIPDAGSLKDLPTPVAITLLIVTLAAVTLFYFSDAIRSRLSRKPPEKPPDPPVPPPVAAPAVEAANSMANEVIAELRERNRGLERQLALQTRRIDELRDEIEQLRLELQRARLRGGRDAY